MDWKKKYLNETLCCASSLNWATNLFTLLQIHFDVYLQKRTTMCQKKVDGHLKMPDLGILIKSLKCTWIRRLIVFPTSPWAKLFETSYGPVKLLFKYSLY